MADIGSLWAVLHIATSKMIFVANRPLFVIGFCAQHEYDDLANELIAMYGIFCILIFVMIGVGYLVPEQSIGMKMSIAAAFLALGIMRLIWNIQSRRIFTPLAFCSLDFATATLIFCGLKSNALV